MSFASWKEEFYPVSADECSHDQALEHSILKWTGLLPENLEKHGMVRLDNCIESLSRDGWLLIDGGSCALCWYHHSSKNGCWTFGDPCPIMSVTGKTCEADYKKFVEEGQVTPMLSLLLRVKEALDAPSAEAPICAAKS